MEEICELTAVDVKRRDERIGRRSVHVVVEYDNTGRINSRYGIMFRIWIFRFLGVELSRVSKHKIE